MNHSGQNGHFDDSDTRAPEQPILLLAQPPISQNYQGVPFFGIISIFVRKIVFSRSRIKRRFEFPPYWVGTSLTTLMFPLGRFRAYNQLSLKYACMENNSHSDKFSERIDRYYYKHRACVFKPPIWIGIRTRSWLPMRSSGLRCHLTTRSYSSSIFRYNGRLIKDSCNFYNGRSADIRFGERCRTSRAIQW